MVSKQPLGCSNQIIETNLSFKIELSVPFTNITFDIHEGLPLSFWCFVRFTLFNLQGTRRRSDGFSSLPQFALFVKYFFVSFETSLHFHPLRSSAANSFILPLLFRFVKNFFRFLSNFCCPRFRSWRRCFEAACIQYHLLRQLSTPFFRFFQLFSNLVFWGYHSLFCSKASGLSAPYAKSRRHHSAQHKTCDRHHFFEQ